MPALEQAIRMAISFKKQVALQTALTAADTWSLHQTNSEVGNPEFINESDAEDKGKGVYATQLIKSYIKSAWPWSGYLTSEAAAQLVCFGVGKTTKTAAGSGFKYTCVEPNFATDALDLPTATVVQQIAAPGGSVTDKALIGMACEEFGFQIKSGPGRQNATFSSSWIGSGAYAKPSTITIPAITAEHRLGAGGISVLSVNGIDYLSNKRFESAEFSWKNNIRESQMFYPGSGQQNGFDIGGRIWRGVPTLSLSVVVAAEAGSSEEDNLINQTEGTATIKIDGATIGAGPDKHSLKMLFQRVVPKATPIGQIDGIVTYNMQFEILQHATNGVVTFEIVNEKDLILS